MVGFGILLVALLPLAAFVGFTGSSSDEEDHDEHGDRLHADNHSNAELSEFMMLDAGEAEGAGHMLQSADEDIPQEESPEASEPSSETDGLDHMNDPSRYSGGERIIGSSEGEIIQGSDQSELIYANGYDSTSLEGNIIRSGDGNNTILGGMGSDYIEGGSGDDLIYASYDIMLDVPVGTDLFEWRDNGLPDTINGGGGDNHIIIGRGDIATGGTGSNVFEVWHDTWVELEPAEITDFQAGQDKLDIVVRIDDHYTPEAYRWDYRPGAPAADFETAETEISRSEDGMYTEVMVNGNVVARLSGPAEISMDDLAVYAFWDIYT